MKNIFRTTVRMAPNTVIIGIGKREEIVKQVEEEMKLKPTKTSETELPETSQPILKFQDEFSEFDVVILDEIPSGEEKCVIKLASWSSAVITTLTSAAIKDFDEGKRAQFLELAIGELLHEIFAFQKKEQDAQAEWRRSVSKIIVPLKKAEKKCDDDAAKEKILTATAAAESSRNKDKAKEIVHATMNDESLKPYFEEQVKSA